ncbi:MAG: winged helix-turn-helix transcriptional regulator [Kiritimatiellae bacterium]|nr:winged helix-turn-helix transcriptional regulator [Kiritimatiellia bacterium]
MGLPVKPSAVEKLVTRVLADIAAGTYAPGSLLPSYKQLARRYGTSYGTIAAALRDLSRRGIVRSQRGRRGGTMVLGRPSGSDADPDVRLRFRVSGAPQKQEAVQVLKRWLESFEREHRDVSCRFTSFPGPTYTGPAEREYFSNTLSSEAATVERVPGTLVRDLAAHGFIAPIVEDVLEVECALSRFHPALRPYLTFEGLLYAWPMNLSVSLVMLTHAGAVPDARSPAPVGGFRWREAIEGSRRGTAERPRILLPTQDDLGLLLVAFVGEFTGDDLSALDTRSWGALLMSDACLEALSVLEQIHGTLGLLLPDEEHASAYRVLSALRGDGPSMTICSSVLGRAVHLLAADGDPPHATLVPGFRKDDGLAPSNAMVWVLTDPRCRESALRFFAWGSEVPNWRWYVRESFRIGRLHHRSPFVNDADYMADLDFFSGCWKELFARASRLLRMEPSWPLGFRHQVGTVLAEQLKEKGLNAKRTQRALCELWERWVRDELYA